LKKGILMRPLALVLVALSAGSVSRAQLAPPNEMGVAMGHLHLNVRDIEADKRFWLALGGVAAKQISANASREVVKFPGVLVTIAKQREEPTGGSVGSVIDHVGFRVPNVAAAVAKWKAAGLRVEPGNRDRTDQAFVTTPDGLRLEILEEPSQATPIAMHHVHIFVPEAALPEIKDYYAKFYGAKLGKRGQFDTATLPGVELAFSKSPDARPTTKGRVLDHIGFEVENLEAFSRKMQASGVKFTRDYRKQDAFGISVLTDPWGVAMELTEGQRQY
jgi:catechol 2,3-dioxygenase-like lactoylglutathione lyase family enzyme